MAADRCRSPVGLSSRPSTFSASDVARARPSTAALGQPLSFLRPWLSSRLPWLPVCTTRAESAACNNGRRGDGHCGLAEPNLLLFLPALTQQIIPTPPNAGRRDRALLPSHAP